MSVRKSLEKKSMRDFLWEGIGEGKGPLLNWSVMMKCVELGG